MEEARQELHRIINDREMKDSLLLVFANKQDLQEGMSLLDYPQTKTMLTSTSHVTPRSHRRSPALQAQGQGLVCRAQLRHQW